MKFHYTTVRTVWWSYFTKHPRYYVHCSECGKVSRPAKDPVEADRIASAHHNEER